MRLNFMAQVRSELGDFQSYRKKLGTFEALGLLLSTLKCYAKIKIESDRNEAVIEALAKAGGINPPKIQLPDQRMASGCILTC